MADRCHAADGEAGVMAHESGDSLCDGAGQCGRDARLVNPFGTAGHDQNRPAVGDGAENYRFANLPHVAAKGGGGFGRRAGAVGQFADGFRSAAARSSARICSTPAAWAMVGPPLFIVYHGNAA